MYARNHSKRVHTFTIYGPFHLILLLVPKENKLNMELFNNILERTLNLHLVCCMQDLDQESEIQVRSLLRGAAAIAAV